MKDAIIISCNDADHRMEGTVVGVFNIHQADGSILYRAHTAKIEFCNGNSYCVAIFKIKPKCNTSSSQPQ